MKMRWLVSAVVLSGTTLGLAQTSAEIAAQGASAKADTFTNPLLDRGPDPWVVYWKGFYYYSNSEGRNLTLRKTADITDLRHAEVKAVWTPEPGHAWSKEVWAPELHRWGKKWYIYFAADAGENSGHRIFVVENGNDDPMEGTWTLLGKVGMRRIGGRSMRQRLNCGGSTTLCGLDGRGDRRRAGFIYRASEGSADD